MLIILDLDHTLLNTASLKKELCKSLINFGVSQKLFKNVYQKLRKDNPYSHELFLDYLSKEKEINRKAAKAKLEKFSKKMRKYLYPEAIWFLKKMRKNGAKLVLLSYGNAKFQKMKIKNIKLEPFFDKVIITEKKKTKSVVKMVNNQKQKIFFIDDHPEEIKEIYQNCKNVIPIFIKHKENSKSLEPKMASKIITFPNFRQMEHYLKSHYE